VLEIADYAFAPHFVPNQLINRLVLVEAPAVAFCANEVESYVVQVDLFVVGVVQLRQQKSLELRGLNTGAHLNVLRCERAADCVSFVLLNYKLAVGVHRFRLWGYYRLSFFAKVLRPF
jgi:hypothetical protein